MNHFFDFSHYLKEKLIKNDKNQRFEGDATWYRSC